MKKFNTYEDFENLGSISQLLEGEREFYLDFLKASYIEDLEHAKEVVISSPKWSIIAGYYAMHNITKYYLGLKYNLRIKLPDIHQATITASKELIKNKEIKDLINIAISEFEEVIPIYYGLVEAKNQRSNLQYYKDTNNQKQNLTKEKSNFFLNTYVEKYIKLIEILIENDN